MLPIREPKTKKLMVKLIYTILIITSLTLVIAVGVVDYNAKYELNIDNGSTTIHLKI